MKFKLHTSDAASVRDIDIEFPSFTGDRGLQALKESIVAYNANARLGTHSTKTRGNVRGGGKKPWRQKGTGRARAGSTRSPIWVGGGVVFGPLPRDYSKKINAKVKILALARAFYEKALAGEVEVVESWMPEGGKTRAASSIIERIISPKNGTILLVDAPFSALGARAARNLENVELREATTVSALDIIKHGRIVLSLAALELLRSRATSIN